MSSLNAAQADGYYIPPSYLESGKYKKQSLNQFVGSKGHNQYVQRSVVRFELPYDGFCVGCQAHVGKGTRFNAHKAHVDDYHSTKIWEFTMKCRACAKMTFKIRTNPREMGFSYVVGIKKKVEEFDTADAGTAGVIDTDLGNGIQPSRTIDTKGSDAMSSLARLEKSAIGKRKAMTERDQIEALLKINAGSMQDDGASNAALRSTYRAARKGKKRRLGEAAAVGLARGIEISDPIEEDVTAAHSAFRDSDVNDKKARQKERNSFMQLRSGSIFGQQKSRGGLKKAARNQKLSSVRTVESARTGSEQETYRAMKLSDPGIGVGEGGAVLSKNDCLEYPIDEPMKFRGSGGSVRGSSQVEGGAKLDRIISPGTSLENDVCGTEKLEGASALSALAAYGSDSD